MDETILYQDDERISPRVLVSKGRLKVGNDSYSLEAASDVSLTTTHHYYRKEPRFWRRMVWVIFGAAVLVVMWMSFGPQSSALIGNSPNAWTNWDIFLVWLFPLAAAILAIREYFRDEQNIWNKDNQYHEAMVTIIRSSTPTKVLVGRFPPRAALTTRELIGTGDEELPVETVVFYKNIERIKAIAEAIGVAIGSKASVDIKSDAQVSG